MKIAKSQKYKKKQEKCQSLMSHESEIWGPLSRVPSLLHQTVWIVTTRARKPKGGSIDLHPQTQKNKT